jgi:hypothetical protein
MGLLDCGRYKYNFCSQWGAEYQVGNIFYYSALTSYLPSTKSTFAYPVQLNALQGFAWVTEYVTLTYIYYSSFKLSPGRL